ncbi:MULTISPECIES: cyclic nucleotide-binding domain-containing protein [Nostocales]|uniref:cyclic nucleotide-binding domain-containing protein n=1 Tax=Nostocales TaxID=1161 RepID=UPI001688254C|nr:MULTISPECIES: cyclic nucleotide-binding domain-containing protein [Nostocales]MBD2299686.1 cyclic nucleotide-binding domain-containing protein [Nostoc sp. FACHB-190]MBD2489593.1 cyclic nucleotide-binding domain-containing protein [Aulosira sp. FACHB-615]
MTEVLLKELSNSDINWIVANSDRQELLPGSLLTSQGKTVDSLYILLDGTLTVNVTQSENNPLHRAFAAIDSDINSDWEIFRVSRGEVVGEVPFVSQSSNITTIKALEKSLVMSIPQEKLAAKLQQDASFAARFYRAIAIMYADRLQKLITQLGRRKLTQAKSLKDVLFVLAELHDSDIDWLMACGITQKVAAGQTLIYENSPVDALYIILRGKMSMSVSEDDRNPLLRAFSAIEGKELIGREIAKLSKGEILGETPFIDGRLPWATVKVIEDSLILAIPKQQLAVKLQQDIGFSSRFYRVISILSANRLQEILSRIGYGRRVYSAGLPLSNNVEYEDEINISILDKMAIASKRFDWMISRMSIA